MTLKQLEAFYWTATLGNFASAAARLHLTPSTLSKRISELEAELDTRLFSRSSQRALPTASGERLIEHARHMLEIQSRIRADVTPSRLFQGTCRFGISELVALTWFPSFVRRVQSLFPDLVLEPHVDLTAHCERKLERGELDFAVIPGPAESTHLRSELICQLDYTWTSSPERLAPDTQLMPQHFIEHPVILLEPQSRLTRLVNDWLTENRIEIRRSLTCNSLSALIELTISGVGISFFPKQYIDPLLSKGYLGRLEYGGDLPNLRYYFESRRDDTRALLRTMRDMVFEEATFQPRVRT
ncbi:LysR family transcriptional regulator [Paraburkholderia hospita]|uniref:LysR family transcriptional regulator n=1 Tax=Paraburkholderia hospita TaxID=169430 RepID=A0ABP2PWQ4_9BURK|nr:LysR family transcriptional regulator [Paraburkholderia hospita]EIN02210.1 LysR family transcriptional regulator [Paraburkholderia hospita]OUL90100.1 LysR family transcriptional regulator [Paraburkholderia hospita]